jgi:hypothetical protein
MNAISKQTATDIALAYREVETAEKLLADVRETSSRTGHKDIRDAFGRTQHGLQLGIPTSETCRTLFNVPYSLAIPIIEAHIAHHQAMISVLTEKAKLEMSQ